MSGRPAPPVSLSVVVPVLRDAEALAATLTTPRVAQDQWIVVNGDTADRAIAQLRTAHPDVIWLDSPPGRGTQLAAGVARAVGDWVIVLHADTRLPPGWREEVTRMAQEASYHWGCFRLRLDSRAWQARLIETGVRLRVRCLWLPYGDQAMCFRRSTLAEVGVPQVPLMEDVMLARRFARLGPPFRSPLPAVTSARRWERDGWWWRTARNLWLLTRYLVGVPPERLASAYPPDRTT